MYFTREIGPGYNEYLNMDDGAMGTCMDVEPVGVGKGPKL